MVGLAIIPKVVLGIWRRCWVSRQRAGRRCLGGAKDFEGRHEASLKLVTMDVRALQRAWMGEPLAVSTLFHQYN